MAEFVRQFSSQVAMQPNWSQRSSATILTAEILSELLRYLEVGPPDLAVLRTCGRVQYRHRWDVHGPGEQRLQFRPAKDRITLDRLAT